METSLALAVCCLEEVAAPISPGRLATGGGDGGSLAAGGGERLDAGGARRSAGSESAGEGRSAGVRDTGVGGAVSGGNALSGRAGGTFAVALTVALTVAVAVAIVASLVVVGTGSRGLGRALKREEMLEFDIQSAR